MSLTYVTKMLQITTILKPLEPVEVDEAADLINASIAINPDGFRARPTESNRDFILRLLKLREAGIAECLVMKSEGKIIGIGGLDPDGMKITNPDGTFPEIARVHVMAEYHRRGYGRRIIEGLIEIAVQLGYERVQLHVTKTQKAALALYKNTGWEAFHEEIFFSQEGGAFPTIFFKKEKEQMASTSVS